LLALSDRFDGRWTYWLKTLESGRPLPGNIPKIRFLSQPNDEAKKNLLDCVRHLQAKGVGACEAWNCFVEWLLWGFAAPIQKEFPPRVDEGTSWYWYKTFNLGLLMKFPCDYMAWASCEIAGMARAGSRDGYFPTPGNVVNMMVDVTMTEADKTKKVCDPCLGTGIMLLYASNYSLRLFGQDIALDKVKMATANAFIYVPWVALPADHLIDWTTQEDWNDALQAIRQWEQRKSCSVPLLTHVQRTNTLNDWI